jgi:hypothetical protein
MMTNNRNILAREEGYVLSNKDQKRLMKMFDQPKMEQYFKDQKGSTNNQQMSYFYVKEIF